jgi:hypothetical protein
MVMMMPSRLMTRFAAAMNVSKSPDVTWMGTQTALTLRAANSAVSPAGDWVWPTGSPTMT